MYYLDVAVWGLDCLGLERPILKELRFAAIQTASDLQLPEGSSKAPLYFGG